MADQKAESFEDVLRSKGIGGPSPAVPQAAPSAPSEPSFADVLASKGISIPSTTANNPGIIPKLQKLGKIGQYAQDAASGVVQMAGDLTSVANGYEAAGSIKGAAPVSDDYARSQEEGAKRLAAVKNGSVLDKAIAVGKNIADAPGHFLAHTAGSLAPYAIAGAGAPALMAAQSLGGAKQAIYDNAKGEREKGGMDSIEAAKLAENDASITGPNAANLALNAGLGFVAGKFGNQGAIAKMAAKTDEATLAKIAGESLKSSIAKETAIQSAVGGAQSAEMANTLNSANSNAGFANAEHHDVIGGGLEGAIGAAIPAPAFAIHGRSTARKTMAQNKAAKEAADAAAAIAQTDPAAANAASEAAARQAVQESGAIPQEVDPFTLQPEPAKAQAQPGDRAVLNDADAIPNEPAPPVRQITPDTPAGAVANTDGTVTLADPKSGLQTTLDPSKGIFQAGLVESELSSGAVSTRLKADEIQMHQENGAALEQQVAQMQQEAQAAQPKAQEFHADRESALSQAQAMSKEAGVDHLPFAVADEAGGRRFISAPIDKIAETVGKSPTSDHAMVVDLAGSSDSHSARSLEALKSKGLDLNAIGSNGETPLTHMLGQENGAGVTRLIRSGADVNAQDKQGYTPLMKAVEIGDRKAMSSLLKAGADPKSTIEGLRATGNESNMKIAQSIADEAARVQAFRPKKEAAIKAEEPSAVKEAVPTVAPEPAIPAAKPVKPSAKRQTMAEKKAQKAQRDASTTGGESDAVVRYNSLNPNYGERGRELTRLIEADDGKSVRAIIADNKGVAYNGINEHSDTPLHLAAKLGKPEVVKELLSHDQSLASEPDHLGRSLLMKAAQGGDAEVIKAMLPHSDPKEADNNGNTALMYAAHYGKADSISELIAHSDLKARNKEGLTAEDIARGQEHNAFAEKLRAASLAQSERSELSEAIKPSSSDDAPAPRKSRRLSEEVSPEDAHSKQELSDRLRSIYNSDRPGLGDSLLKVIKVRSAAEIGRDGEAVTKGTKGFAERNGEVTLVHDQIAKAKTDAELKGLIDHEVAVHAAYLGKGQPEFASVKARFEEAVKNGNRKMKEAADRVPADTDPAHRTEEGIAYTLEMHPESPVATRVAEWFRQSLRGLAKGMPLSESGRFYKWVNELTVPELQSMARKALLDHVDQRSKGGKVLTSQDERTAADGSKFKVASQFSKTEQVKVGLSAATHSIPGIKALHELASSGDQSAHKLLHEIASDNLKTLLANTGAKIDRTIKATGLYGGEAEAALGLAVSFGPKDKPRVLAALAKFADNFNQDQVHVRESTSERLGTKFDDGSYATPVYRSELKKPLSREEIANIIDKSGLYGLTFSEGHVEAYFVGDAHEKAAIDSFAQSIGRLHELLGENRGESKQTIERLYPYGHGDGAISYDTIKGNLSTGKSADVESSKRVADFLAEKAGRDPVKTFGNTKGGVSPEQRALQEKIAKAYEALPDNDLKSPYVKKAYEALAREVKQQFEALPIKLTFKEGGEPYKAEFAGDNPSDAMRRDIAQNNALSVYKTGKDSFGPAGVDFSGHPLLEDSGLKGVTLHEQADGSVKRTVEPLLYNDLFRAVHDYYAHTLEATSFGPVGEEAAWRNHMSMTNDPLARWALTAETRGQNSWVNFHEGLDQSKPLAERDFARQKAALLPIEYSMTGDRSIDRHMDSLVSEVNGGRRLSVEEPRNMGEKRAARRLSEEAAAEQTLDLAFGKFQDFQTKYVNMFAPLRSMVARAEKILGAKIDDARNPMFAQDVAKGKASTQFEEFKSKHFTPLADYMKSAGINMESMSDYLHARHAIERNAEMKRINPDIKNNEALSGKSDADAIKVLGVDISRMSESDAREALRQQNPAMEKAAEMFDSMVKDTRKRMVESGVESKEAAASWEKKYKFYAPLKRDIIDGMSLGAGSKVQGAAHLGGKVKLAHGSDAPVQNIIAHAVMDAHKQINRAAENEFRKTTAAFFKAYDKDGKVAKLDRPAEADGGDARFAPDANDQYDYEQPRAPKFNMDEHGNVESVEHVTDPNFANKPNVVMYRVAGKDYAIVFNEKSKSAMSIAKAFGYADDVSKYAVVEYAGKVTNYISRINTSYNPFFGFKNIIRDAGHAQIALQGTPLKGKNAELFRNQVSALKTVWVESRNLAKGIPATTEAGKQFRQMREDGVGGGYSDQYKDANDAVKKLAHEVDPDWFLKTKLGAVFNQSDMTKPFGRNVAKLGQAVKHGLDLWNDTLENSTRLAIYKTGLDNGMSRAQSGSLAANLTINFSHKGTDTALMNKFYGFFNAQLQGTAAIARVMTVPGEKGPYGLPFKISDAGKQIILAGIAVGVAQSAMTQAAGFKDGEISENDKAKNFTIPTGGKSYVSIPMAQGFSLLPTIGRLIHETITEGKPMSRAVDLLQALADTFSPIGNSGSFAQSLAPTALDPFVALSANTDGLGKPIARTDINGDNPTPGFTRTKDTATIFSKWLSQMVNSVSGGTDFKPGTVSPTPDQIDFVMGVIGGGLFREGMRVEQAAAAAVTGEAVEPNKLPLVSGYARDADSNGAVSGQFHQFVQEMNAHKLEIEGRKKKGIPFSDYQADNPESRMVSYMDSVQSRLKHLSADRKKELERGNKDRVKDLENRIADTQRQFNEKIRDAKAN